MDKFVCVRVVKANQMDLTLMQFDYDLTFAVMFMNADKTVYGRFGSRSELGHPGRHLQERVEVSDRLQVARGLGRQRGRRAVGVQPCADEVGPFPRPPRGGAQPHRMRGRAHVSSDAE